MKVLAAILGVWMVSLGVQAGPNINVGVVYDYLDGSKSSYLKRIFNGGTSTAFVKVEILEIVYDASGVPQEIPVQSQADASARDGLMASPARLIVPANGMQGTRLLYMGERASERYFRVRYIPVVPEKEDAFALSEEEREEYQKTLRPASACWPAMARCFSCAPRTPATTPASTMAPLAMNCATTATA